MIPYKTTICLVSSCGNLKTIHWILVQIPRCLVCVLVITFLLHKIQKDYVSEKSRYTFWHEKKLSTLKLVYLLACYIRDKLSIVIFVLGAYFLPPIFEEVVHSSISIAHNLYMIPTCPDLHPYQGYIDVKWTV